MRHFHVVVVQKWERYVQKSVLHVRSCCFANLTNCFLDVLVVVRRKRRNEFAEWHVARLAE